MGAATHATRRTEGGGTRRTDKRRGATGTGGAGGPSVGEGQRDELLESVLCSTMRGRSIGWMVLSQTGNHPRGRENPVPCWEEGRPRSGRPKGNIYTRAVCTAAYSEGVGERGGVRENGGERDKRFRSRGRIKRSVSRQIDETGVWRGWEGPFPMQGVSSGRMAALQKTEREKAVSKGVSVVVRDA